MRTTIDRAGRVVIPAAIRKRARLTPGTKIEVTLEDGSVRRLLDTRRRGAGPQAAVTSTRLRPFLAAVAEERIVGGRIYDAHIAEIARQARVGVVVTDNIRHFTGLVRQGIRVATAADFARETEA